MSDREPDVRVPDAIPADPRLLAPWPALREVEPIRVWLGPLLREHVGEGP